MIKINDFTDKEENKTHSSYNTRNVTSFLDFSNPKPLTPVQKAELAALANMSDDTVRKEAEADPDCEPLE